MKYTKLIGIALLFIMAFTSLCACQMPEQDASNISATTDNASTEITAEVNGNVSIENSVESSETEETQNINDSDELEILTSPNSNSENTTVTTQSETQPTTEMEIETEPQQSKIELPFVPAE